MNKSESIAALAEALSLAQSEIKGAAKTSENPYFHAKYADLASVWDACREPLTKNGLSVIQTTEPASPNGDSDFSNHSVIIETVLAHKSGEWISGSLRVTPTKDDPQGLGSAITYGRRYGLAAIVGVAPEDDDGNAASQPDNRSTAQRRPQNTDEALKGELLKQAEKLAVQAGYAPAKVKTALGRLAKKTTAEIQTAIEELKQKIAIQRAPAEPTDEGESLLTSTRKAIYDLFSKLNWDDEAISRYLGDKTLEEITSLDRLIEIHDELQGDGPAF